MDSMVLNKLLNMNKRKLGVFLIIVFVSVLILFPFIDTNLFYANRIKNRVDILQKITELDMDKISQNQNLMKEYDSIVKEINESDSNYINKVLNNRKNDYIIEKFISGGALWWLLWIIVLFFYNIFNKEDNKNYIIIPILVLILIILLLYKTTSNIHYIYPSKWEIKERKKNRLLF